MQYRILLIEDDELNRDMLSRRLERKKFEVVVAIDGQDGVEKTISLKPDLILLDMSLPRLSGWEVAKCLKALADTKQIPIIALTAHAMSGDKLRALEAGCDEFDSKPIEFQRLLEKIEKLLLK